MKEKKQKTKHLSLKEVTFSCVSCNSQYISIGVFPKKGMIERINSCSNCCPAYTGNLARESKVGSVERFRSREQKTKKKQESQT